MMRVAAFFLLIATATAADEKTWNGTQLEDLWDQYYNIFTSGNRNAASHKWSTFLLDRSHNHDAETFRHLSSGYCPISGSPVTPQARTRYRVTLDAVSGGKKTGVLHHCCWPCVCDAADFVKVDTKDVKTKDGVHQYNFVVIGNPCKHPEKIEEMGLLREAPEMKCNEKGELEGAHLSDNGHVILSMFHDEKPGIELMEQSAFAQQCQSRAASGYQSGMGDIFRKVGSINMIQVPSESKSSSLRK